MITSCLDFLDYDVSQYIGETYFPSKRVKEMKSLVNDQYKYHLKDYIYMRGDDILKSGAATEYRTDGSSYLVKHNFIRYLLKVHKNGSIKKKRKKRYFNETPGHLRAIDYRREMRRIRRNLKFDLEIL